MSFINAFKIFINKFSIIWTLVLYVLVLALIVGSASLPFLSVMIRAVENAGIFEQINDVYKSILDGIPLDELVAQIKEIFENFRSLMFVDKAFTISSTVFVFLIITIVYRFLFGLYEVPMLSVLEGAMSSNAKFSFFGNFISRLGISARFVLAKMIYTILFDSVIFIIIYFMLNIFKLPGGVILAPFLIMVVWLTLISLRFTLISMWAPSVVCEKKSIWAGFIFSVKKSKKHFKSIFLAHAVLLLLVASVNVFVGIFTFGIGLLATIPITIMLVLILNITIFYNKNNKRYYVDELVVVTPPLINDGIN